jgi:hypothetical protein
MKIDFVRVVLPLQLVVALVVGPALLLTPPAHGRMLLVPLTGGSGAHLAADLVDRGGRLLAPGPFAGSLVVEGDRDRLTAGLLARGVVAVRAVALLCGESAEDAR